jgi:hypothetical protein
MTSAINKLILSKGFLICLSCDGEGKIGDSCGYDSTRTCPHCAGNGIVLSLKTQNQNKKCGICKGRDGGCGGCNFNAKGLIEWESYELICKES